MTHPIQHRWLRFKRHLRPTTRLRARLTNGAWAATTRETDASFATGESR